MAGFLAGIPWLKLITAAPPMMNATTKLLETVKGRVHARPAQDFTGLQKRLDTIEGHQETQAELMAQLTQHHAALLRWLLMLTLAFAVIGGIAIAALVIAILR